MPRTCNDCGDQPVKETKHGIRLDRCADCLVASHVDALDLAAPA